MNINKKLCYLLFLYLASVSLLAQDTQSPGNNAETSVQVAQFDNENRLIKPGNVDEWILLGVSVGHGYPDENDSEFSLNNPGKLQVIQMEPNAYQFFKDNNYYAKGTMLSLSFYEPLSNPSPAIGGLAQGELATFEIHLIDKVQYADTRAFFLYEPGEEVAPMVEPAGNRCVQCHEAEADFDGTFSQFYPIVRDILSGNK